jgi:ribonuclease Z
MELVFLGTSSSFPTKERNHPAILLKLAKESILFDCGEGTQRQIRISKENPMRITKIFITHWHGDHSLGLPGLLSSFGMNKRTGQLDIFGPRGTKKGLEHLKKAFNVYFQFRLKSNDIDAKKIKKIDKEKNYIISAVKLDHKIPCLAYSFETKPQVKINKEFLKKHKIKSSPKLKKLKEGKTITIDGKRITPRQALITQQGKKITYVTDTKSCKQAVDIAKDSDILICEATFTDVLKSKAKEMYHMTAKQAAKIAKKAKVKQLYLTHSSQRYKSAKPLVDEAKKVFKNTKAAKDFLKVKI